MGVVDEVQTVIDVETNKEVVDVVYRTVRGPKR